MFVTALGFQGLDPIIWQTKFEDGKNIMNGKSLLISIEHYFTSNNEKEKSTYLHCRSSFVLMSVQSMTLDISVHCYVLSLTHLSNERLN